MDTKKHNVHIIGNSGRGKTFYASKQAIELLAEGKKVLYIDYYKVDTFPDAPSLIIDPIVTFGNDFDKFTYENLEKILKDFLQVNPSAKIIISVGEMGELRAKHILDLTADFILNNKDIFSDYYIFVDDVDKLNQDKLQQLLKDSSNNNISYTLIHQYLDQFSEEVSEALLKECKNIIFKSAHGDCERIASMYGIDLDSLYNLPSYEYKELGPM
jgi:hypothetical protein